VRGRPGDHRVIAMGWASGRGRRLEREKRADVAAQRPLWFAFEQFDFGGFHGGGYRYLTQVEAAIEIEGDGSDSGHVAERIDGGDLQTMARWVEAQVDVPASPVEQVGESLSMILLPKSQDRARIFETNVVKGQIHAVMTLHRVVVQNCICVEDSAAPDRFGQGNGMEPSSLIETAFQERGKAICHDLTTFVGRVDIIAQEARHDIGPNLGKPFFGHVQQWDAKFLAEFAGLRVEIMMKRRCPTAVMKKKGRVGPDILSHKCHVEKQFAPARRRRQGMQGKGRRVYLEQNVAERPELCGGKAQVGGDHVRLLGAQPDPKHGNVWCLDTQPVDGGIGEAGSCGHVRKADDQETAGWHIGPLAAMLGHTLRGGHFMTKALTKPPPLIRPEVAP